MSVSVVRLNICSTEAALAQVKEGDKIKVDLSTLSDKLKLHMMENGKNRKSSLRLAKDQVLILHQLLKDGAGAAGFFIPASWCHTHEEVEAQNFPIDNDQLQKAWKTNNKNSSHVVPKFIKSITDEKVSH